jgi:hypothetical protein
MNAPKKETKDAETYTASEVLPPSLLTLEEFRQTAARLEKVLDLQGKALLTHEGSVISNLEEFIRQNQVQQMEFLKRQIQGQYDCFFQNQQQMFNQMELLRQIIERSERNSENLSTRTDEIYAIVKHLDDRRLFEQSQRALTPCHYGKNCHNLASCDYFHGER